MHPTPSLSVTPAKHAPRSSTSVIPAILLPPPALLAQLDTSGKLADKAATLALTSFPSVLNALRLTMLAPTLLAQPAPQTTSPLVKSAHLAERSSPTAPPAPPKLSVLLACPPSMPPWLEILAKPAVKLPAALPAKTTAKTLRLA